MRQQRQRGGYIALTTVLIVGMVASLIVVSLLALGLGYSRSSASTVSSAQARSAADACAEEALRQIRLNTNYTVTGATLTIGSSSCSYTVTNTGGATRQIDATGTALTAVLKERVVISALSPKITVSSWQDIP